jgi:cytoskeletal protein RodZ
MYRRAMLRAYAESVGLDPQAALQAFTVTFEAKSAVAVGTVEAVAPAPPIAKSKSLPRSLPRRRMLTVVGACALATIAALVVSGRRRDAAGLRPSSSRPTQNFAGPPPPAPRPAAAPSPDASSPTDQPLETNEDAVVGPLVVQSNPAGARVTINGIGWGVTPITIRNLPAGPKRVRLTKDGYVSQERTVILDPTGQAVSARVTLPSQSQ